MTVLSASKLALNYGDVEIFSGVTLEIPEHARIGVVGPNGSGKSSLLKIIVGELEPDGGNLYRTGGVRIGYVPQTPALSTEGTLRDEIMTAFDDVFALEKAIEKSLAELAESPPEQCSEAEAAYAALLEEYEASGGYNYQSRMEQVAAGIGLSPAALASPAISASGGERTRAALAQALLSSPDLLVLDEPTNHLDLEGLAWLERFLNHYPSAFLVVSHDRYFLDQVVTQIWELDHERFQAFAGNYSKYRVLKGEQTLWQRRRYQRQQEYIAKEEAFIRRYGAGQRSREARGRANRLDRLEREAAPERDQQISLSRHSVGRTGLVTLRTENLKIGFAGNGENRELFAVPDLRLERGSRAAILGNNGTGKTTLLKTIQGLAPPLEGAATLGHKVAVGYFSQELEAIPEESTVFEALLEARDIP
ncbi:MAG: ABC-F family ATP-binding cassette domain-containing protein, partial [Dehalococcoidia bacterium]